MDLGNSTKLVVPDVVGHQPQRPGPALLGHAGGEGCQGEGEEMGWPEHLVEKKSFSESIFEANMRRRRRLCFVT